MVHRTLLALALAIALIPQVASAHRLHRPHHRVPVGSVAWMSVSAYSFGCGAGWHDTAYGEWPHVGGAATFGLPYGTRVFVPGFGTVRVNDTGVPAGYLDLFVSSCSAAWLWGRRELRVTIFR